MAQYIKYTDPDTGLKVREGVRDGDYCVDCELTVLGFAGAENVDWENIEELKPEA